VPGCERVFDAVLALPDPVHGVIEVVFVARRDPEHLAERARCGLFAKPSGGVELGGRVDHLGHDHRDHDHRDHEIALARRLGADELFEPKAAQRPTDRREVAVRGAASDLERRGEIGERRGARERQAQGLHLVLGPVAEVGERAVLHLGGLAVALSQQHRWR
jgi:hypothetical protein